MTKNRYILLEGNLLLRRNRNDSAQYSSFLKEEVDHLNIVAQMWRNLNEYLLSHYL